MSMAIAFFSAIDDESALEAERRPGGPLGWPQVTGRRKSGLFRREPIISEIGPAYDGFEWRGYDPVVNMGTLEELLTGRDLDVVMEDERSGGSPGGAEAPENHGVITLTDSLRDALAQSNDDRLMEIVEPWSRTEELQQPGWEDVSPIEHLEFLRALRDLARRAASEGHRLYFYFAF